MTGDWFGRLLRWLAIAMALAVVTVCALLPMRIAWKLISSPTFGAEQESQARLLLDSVGLTIAGVLLVVTMFSAVATWLTVREMRAGRLQADVLETGRAVAALQAQIRDQGWFLIVEFHSAMGGLSGVTATLERAAVFGRVRRSVEAPLMREAFDANRGATRAIVSAQRLADTPGPWQDPASVLAELLLEAIESVTDRARLLDIARRGAEPLATLRRVLPRVSMEEQVAAR